MAIKIMAIMEEIRKGNDPEYNSELILNMLGVDNESALTYIKAFFTPRFYVDNEDEKKMLESLNLPPDKLKDIKGPKVFDYEIDYDMYYGDFKKYFNIDLIEDDIDWVKFNFLLDCIMEYEDSALSKRIRYRTYKPNKDDNTEYKNFMLGKKELYKLEDDSKKDKYNYEKFK